MSILEAKKSFSVYYQIGSRCYSLKTKPSVSILSVVREDVKDFFGTNMFSIDIYN
jgi:hypothetical protein